MNLGHDDVIDVTGWTVIRVEQGGRDANKRWLAESPTAPRSEHWLWKSRQRTGGGDERALTDCAEVTVSRLAALLGLPAADCRYASDDGQTGLVSRNVAGDLDLYTGATYLPEVEGYERDIDLAARPGLMGAERGYTLSAVQDVLRGVGPPPTADQSLSAFEVFAGFLVLDALVGNGDRHPGNWALLETASGARLLAPTYDHGSALGAGLTELNRADRSPHAFARRGRANPFSPPKTSLVDLAVDAVGRCDGAPWPAAVANLQESDVTCALQAPADRMSEVAATFMKAVILENQRRLTHAYAA